VPIGEGPDAARGSLARRARWLSLVALLVLAGGAVAEAAQDSPPASPFIDRNACPVESGCNFHADWVAETPLTAYAVEGRPTRVAFRIATGEHFAALRADMYVTRPGIVVMVAPLDPNCEPPDCWEPGFRAGELVYVLSYRGGGHYLISHRGRLREVDAFWAAQSSRQARVRQAPEMFWWVLVRNQSGRLGWLRLKNTADVGIAFDERIRFP
jgi:hypothetical protein